MSSLATIGYETEATINKGSLPPAQHVLSCWYAAHTRAQHEKRVAEQLGHRGIEHFLPLYERISRWKDRRVRLQVPLFDGYVFVRIALKNRLQVLEVPGVARLVSFNGRPAPLAESDMEILRRGLSSRLRAEPHPYLCAGNHVRIRGGPFAGMEGILLRKKNPLRVVLSLEQIARAISVEIDLADIEPSSMRNLEMWHKASASCQALGFNR